MWPLVAAVDIGLVPYQLDLVDSRKKAFEGSLPEADAAHREAAHVAARSPADGAAVVLPCGEPWRALCLRDH